MTEQPRIVVETDGTGNSEVKSDSGAQKKAGSDAGLLGAGAKIAAPVVKPAPASTARVPILVEPSAGGEKSSLAKESRDLKAMPPPTQPSTVHREFTRSTISMDKAILTKGRRFNLKEGHSPMDWAAYRGSGKNLRGVNSPFPLRITLEELAKHKTREDAWTCLQGKVYNLTPYLDFHPGGVDILVSVFGRDGTKMFERIHRWVNFEYLLEPCLVGFLVPA